MLRFSTQKRREEPIEITTKQIEAAVRTIIEQSVEWQSPFCIKVMIVYENKLHSINSGKFVALAKTAWNLTEDRQRNQTTMVIPQHRHWMYQHWQSHFQWKQELYKVNSSNQHCSLTIRSFYKNVRGIQLVCLTILPLRTLKDGIRSFGLQKQTQCPKKYMYIYYLPLGHIFVLTST